MAHSIDEIYQAIQAEKNTMSVINSKLTNEDGSTTLNSEQDLLISLQTTSKVSIWKLWAYIFAVVSNFLEQSWDNFKLILEGIKDTTAVYTAKWWTEKAKEWQYGYQLESLSDNSLGYSATDLAAQLIEHAAVTDIPGKVSLKVRRKDTDILSVLELASFESYIAKLKPIGDRVIITNYQADDIKLYYTIYYDPFYASTIVSAVNSVINDYLKNIGFNSELNVTDLTDALQAVSGVIDPVFVSAEGKHQGSSYQSFTNYYTAVAGYCKIDATFPLGTLLTDYPLLGTIQYIAKSI